MQVSAQYAFSHFDDIASAVDRGEPVEILRPGKPALQLVTAPAAVRSRKTLFGAWEGMGIVLPTEEEWRAMDKELEQQMNDASLMTTGEV